MTTLAEASAASVDVEIDGKEYRFSKMLAVDWGEFSNWMQDKYLESFLRNLDKVPEDLREEYRREAHHKAATIGMNSTDMWERIASMDAMIKLSHLCLRRHHPDIEMSEIEELMSNPITADRIVSAVDRMTDVHKKNLGRVLRKKNMGVVTRAVLNKDRRKARNRKKRSRKSKKKSRKM